MSRLKIQREMPRKNLFLKVLFVLIFSFAAFLIIRTTDRISDKKTELDGLIKIENSLRISNEKKMQKLDRPVNDEYIAEYAKEKLNYRNPNEIIFYINSEE